MKLVYLFLVAACAVPLHGMKRGRGGDDEESVPGKRRGDSLSEIVRDPSQMAGLRNYIRLCLQDRNKINEAISAVSEVMNHGYNLSEDDVQQLWGLLSMRVHEPQRSQQELNLYAAISQMFLGTVHPAPDS